MIIHECRNSDDLKPPGQHETGCHASRQYRTMFSRCCRCCWMVVDALEQPARYVILLGNPGDRSKTERILALANA